MCMLIEKTCSCDGLVQKSRFTNFFFLFLRIPWIFAMRVYTVSWSTFPSYGVEFCFSAVGPGQVFKVWDSDRPSGNAVSGLGEKQEEGRRGEKQPTNPVLFWGQEKQLNLNPRKATVHKAQWTALLHVSVPSCPWDWLNPTCPALEQNSGSLGADNAPGSGLSKGFPVLLSLTLTTVPRDSYYRSFLQMRKLRLWVIMWL